MFLLCFSFGPSLAGIIIISLESGRTGLRELFARLVKVAIAEVTASYSELFSQGGISVSPDPSNKAAEATEGYPFLIQWSATTA